MLPFTFTMSLPTSQWVQLVLVDFVNGVLLDNLNHEPVRSKKQKEQMLLLTMTHCDVTFGQSIVPLSTLPPPALSPCTLYHAHCDEGQDEVHKLCDKSTYT